MKVFIDNETDAAFEVDSFEHVIGSAVNCVAEEHGIAGYMEVNVLITDLEGIHNINYETRGIDSPTDVLSFPYFEFSEPGVFSSEPDPDGDEEIILGDIVLCAERIISQANEYGHSQEREMAFLTVHSMLHLLGYDHIEEEDGVIMRTEEKRLMEKLGIFRN